MFEIHYKYTDYQTFKQTFRELFFPFLIIFQPLIRIFNKKINPLKKINYFCKCLHPTTIHKINQNEQTYTSTDFALLGYNGLFK